MGRLRVGTVLSCRFPFTDLSSDKVRPAVIVAKAELGDIILCQITSRNYSSKKAIALKSTDFESGALPIDSYIRPDKLFTANTTIIKTVYGVISKVKQEQLSDSIKSLF
ncbi:type II toxin-antitoxin system PemK/MazF family toxin [Candidatus Nomurabacteria bacterium]|nr:type II toxin-antitoxin system PemK/MazF family toxin [Candidatus Nomurabacteria bacterium]